ncbi:MAG: VWA domain-containing protein [Proteobacteria bacterium]|nr:VWA domain-containing protein [Pseudomonadota bacterium]
MSDRLRRWRLVLGEPAGEGTGVSLEGSDASMDLVLSELYDGSRASGLGRSRPKVHRWLGDIRRFFPKSVVQMMQRDAMERLQLTELLLEPELLESVEADVHLVATLMSLSKVMPDETKATARQVVAKVVREVEDHLREPLKQAVRGSLSRARRMRRPRMADVDWDRTIRANLGNYLPERRVLIAEHVVGFARRARALHDVLLVVDQSGSMGTSVVYSGIFGAVLASIPALATRMIVFDTEVADLTEQLVDPVDMLFGVQLGGGTDIHRALVYAASQVRRPQKTVLVLVSDLFEGGDAQGMLRVAAELVQSGVLVVVLLALSDDGTPVFSTPLAGRLAELGVACFACTPDQFPALIAAALDRRDLKTWAGAQGIDVKG